MLDAPLINYLEYFSFIDCSKEIIVLYSIFIIRYVIILGINNTTTKTKLFNFINPKIVTIITIDIKLISGFLTNKIIAI